MHKNEISARALNDDAVHIPDIQPPCEFPCVKKISADKVTFLPKSLNFIFTLRERGISLSAVALAMLAWVEIFITEIPVEQTQTHLGKLDSVALIKGEYWKLLRKTVLKWC
jgi:hypothetical protein